jgi:hypothetical protein
MSYNIISYSLFNPKQNHYHRTYDRCNTESNRYWYNIPALLIVNRLFYTDFYVRVQIDPSLQNHFLYPFLHSLMQSYKMFQIAVQNYAYINTEPTIWRMVPVWDHNNLVLCRDIDSIPNTAEIKATLAFASSKYIIHTIRSHPNHNSFNTRILAGLCAFKSDVHKHIVHSFDVFYKMAHKEWGCDQSVLMNYWIERTGTEFVKNYILDTAIPCIGYMCEHIAGFDAGKLNKDDYENIDLSFVSTDIKNLIDSKTAWCGEPIDARGDYTKYLLNLDNDVSKAIKKCILQDKYAKEFYGM